MGRNAVGFYWTLPVPWAGFTGLPKDVDKAAKASWTIRYQREAIRQHANEQGYRLIHEEVFLEIAPDRGNKLIVHVLTKIESICRMRDAILLFVDFSEVQLWRRTFAAIPLAGTGQNTPPLDESSVAGQDEYCGYRMQIK